MEKLEVDSKSGSDEEFFDCVGMCLLTLLIRFMDFTLHQQKNFILCWN